MLMESLCENDEFAVPIEIVNATIKRQEKYGIVWTKPVDEKTRQRRVQGIVRWFRKRHEINAGVN